MRILYFYQYFTTPKGAYNTRVYEFARRWVKAGHEVTVITSVFDRSDLRPSSFMSRVQIDGIDIRVINVGLSNKHGILHRLCTFLLYAVAACWFAVTLPAEVVVASSGPISVGLPGLAARYLRGRPLVFEVRDLWPEGAIQMGYLTNPVLKFFARKFEQLCYRASSRVVALSLGMAEWIRSTYHIHHVEVVTNASDNRMFEGEGVPALPDEFQGKDIVVYAGNLGPGDDCEQILDMSKELRRYPRGGQIEVVVIGDGKQGLQLRERASREQLPVRFLGLMEREKLVPFLTVARCAVFCTKNLPFYNTCSPNKLFDAFAAGVPIVQTTQGWIKDLIEREQCGITVPPNDPVKMAEAVIAIADDSNLRTCMSSHARRLAREVFDRDILSSKMLQILVSAGQSKERDVPDFSDEPSRRAY